MVNVVSYSDKINSHLNLFKHFNIQENESKSQTSWWDEISMSGTLHHTSGVLFIMNSSLSSRETYNRQGSYIGSMAHQPTNYTITAASTTLIPTTWFTVFVVCKFNLLQKVISHRKESFYIMTLEMCLYSVRYMWCIGEMHY